MFSMHSKLLMLVSMHRHGARSPEKYYNATWFPIGKKQLTPLGAHQMQALGSFYRTKYFSQLSMSESSKNYPIYISSPLQRTFDSAKNVYRGLYPNESHSHFNEIPVDFTQKWSWDSLNNVIHEGLPILVQKDTSDYLFHGFKKNICPKADRLMDRKTRCEEAMTKLEELRETFFPILSKGLKKCMGIEIEPKKMSFSNMKGVYDVIVSTKAHDVKVDFGLSDEQFEKLTKERRDFVLNYKLGDSELIRISTSVFFSLLRTFFNEKKKEALSDPHKHNNSLLKHVEITPIFKQVNETPKFTSNMVLFSGHDTILNLILNAMLTREEKDELGSELDLKYGSHLDFELLEENGVLYVMCYMNEKLLNLTKCNKGTKGKCTLDDFEGFLKDSILEDLQGECSKVEGNNS